jgi:hypothetical protein
MKPIKTLIGLAAISTLYVAFAIVAHARQTNAPPAVHSTPAGSNAVTAKTINPDEWEFTLDGTARYAIFGPAVTTGSNRVYHVTITTNAPEPTVTKSECDQKVLNAFKMGVDAGIDAADMTTYKKERATRHQEAYQNVPPPPRQ